MIQGNAVMDRDEAKSRQPEVVGQVNQLHAAAKMLEEVVAMLETRLAPVLAERKVANGAGGTGTPEPVRVPLAEELHTACGAFTRVRDQIESIVSRLEI